MSVSTQIDASTAVSQGAASFSPVVWFYLKGDVKLNSGVRNSHFGYAYKIAQRIGAEFHIIADNQGKLQEARDLYRDYDIRYELLSDLKEQKDSLQPPAVFLSAPNETDAIWIWSEVKSHIWGKQHVTTPITENRPHDMDGPASHRLTLELMDKAQEKYACADTYPQPRINVQLANPSESQLARFLAEIEALLEQHPKATLSISTSPRSRESGERMIRFFNGLKEVISRHKEVGKNIKYYQYDFDQSVIATTPHFPVSPEGKAKIKNPYVGMLASADAVVILGDSWSMASEAAMVGCPVYYEGNNPLLFMANAQQRLGEEGAKRYKPLVELKGFNQEERYARQDATDYSIEMFMPRYTRFTQQAAKTV